MNHRWAQHTRLCLSFAFAGWSYWARLKRVWFAHRDTKAHPNKMGWAEISLHLQCQCKGALHSALPQLSTALCLGLTTQQEYVLQTGDRLFLKLTMQYVSAYSVSVHAASQSMQRISPCSVSVHAASQSMQRASPCSVSVHGARWLTQHPLVANSENTQQDLWQKLLDISSKLNSSPRPEKWLGQRKNSLNNHKIDTFSTGVTLWHQRGNKPS